MPWWQRQAYLQGMLEEIQERNRNGGGDGGSTSEVTPLDGASQAELASLGISTT